MTASYSCLVQCMPVQGDCLPFAASLPKQRKELRRPTTANMAGPALRALTLLMWGLPVGSAAWGARRPMAAAHEPTRSSESYPAHRSQQ